jgi:hypothetical protein
MSRTTSDIRRRPPRVCASLAVVGTVAFLGATAIGGQVASASTPVENGCPAAFQLLTLDFLASQGPYRQPFEIDAAGNNDGLICAMPVNQTAYDAVCGPDCPVPVLYTFIDNKEGP